MQIRKASAQDAHLCWDIRNRAILAGCADCYDEADLVVWTQGELTESFTQVVAQFMYVAVIDGRVVGTAMLDEANAQVEALFVEPQVMGQGVGKRLLHFIERKANLLGLAELRLESTLNAAAFYRAHGFGGAGREEDSVYLSPRGIALDCVVMYKTLSSDVMPAAF